MWRYIASLLLSTCWSLSLLAQESTVALDSAAVQDSTTTIVKKRRGPRPDFRPSAFRSGIDLYNIGNSLLENGQQTLELQADIDFHRYFLNVEFGVENTDYSDTNFDYNSNGAFWRVGVDWNLTPYNPERNTIYMGLRYGRSSFSEEINFNASDSIWQDAQFGLSGNNLAARWLELTAGMKVRVWQGLFLGYIIRYKISRRLTKGVDRLDTYEIPGYGLYRKHTNLDFGFYLYYRLAFRYKAVPERPSK